MKKVYDEKKPALRIVAHYENFDGGIERWKDSFYILWRYQLTWDFAYRIDVRESRKRGVYVDLLIQPAYKDTLLETMDDLGYKDIQTDETFVGLIDAYDIGDIEELILDY